MSPMVLVLVAGTVLALGALAFVLHPLFAEVSRAPAPAIPVADPDAEAAERAIAALREVEFDRATGKLSDDDYAALKATYTAEAVRAIRAVEGPGAAGEAPALVPDETVEALIGRYRRATVACPRCGERPEPAARFCSSCGRTLEDSPVAAAS